jgi:pimeloyl-ACP methyl ester carboxylesterase
VTRDVVLLHGIGGAAWELTLPALAGHHAVAWHMPGYGGTAPPAEVTFPALGAALRAFLDARGIARADLVGHSIGGMVAQEFALTFPDRVRALVLYATTPAFGGRDPSFREAFLAARLAPLDAGRGMDAMAAELLDGLMGEDPDPAAFPAAAAAIARVPEATYRATLKGLVTFDRRADLPRITAPALLVAGERDTTAPARTMRRMAEAMPRARLVVIPGAGHLIHLERPAAFNAALAEFLAGIEA